MSRDKLLIIGVVVLALLGFLVYRQQQKDAAIGTAVAVAAKDFPTINAPDDVDRVSITNGDKPEIVLEHVPDPRGTPTDGGPAMMWVLTKPLRANANQQTVKDLVSNLRDLKVDSQVNLKLDDDVRKDKQLDPAHALHVQAWKAGDKKIDEIFGKSGPAGQLVMVGDKPDTVWAAKGYSSYLYTKEPKDFRDKEIFKFDDGNVAQVTIANTHGTLSFTKGDKWAATFDKQPLPRFAEDKLKDMLRAYKALNADDFGDNKALADVGLDRPTSTVTLTLKDGAGTYQLLLGNNSTGTNRWVKKGDADPIYSITNFSAEWATSDQTKFQLPADAGAPGDGGLKK